MAAGEFALLGLGEDIMVLFLDLGKDIFELRSEAQSLRKRSALSAQGHSRWARCQAEAFFELSKKV